MKQNKDGFLKVLTRNWGLKLVSFIIAVALWLIVVNVNDPTIRYSWSNIPVTIENGDMITSQGMIYEVLDGTDVVPKVTIQAPKSVIQNIDKSDIVATADMSKLNSVNTFSLIIAEMGFAFTSASALLNPASARHFASCSESPYA